MTAPNLIDVIGEAGLTEHEIDYLRAAGATTARHLIRVAETEAEFNELVIAPFIAGTILETTEFKAERSAMTTKTSFLVARDLCFDWKHEKDLKHSTLAPNTTGMAASAASAAGIPAQVATSCTTLSTTDWRAGIDSWEQQWTPKRDFPVLLLQGAERALARLVYEARTTRKFSPLALIEIVQSRTFNPDGSYNKQQKAKLSNLEVHAEGIAKALGHDAEFEIEFKEDRNLTTLLALDCLEANSWALKWAGYGTENECNSACQWWTQLLRGERCPDASVFQHIYLAFGWKVSFAMRGGLTWFDAHKATSEDKEWLDNEIRSAQSKRSGRIYQGEPRHQPHERQDRDRRGDQRRDAYRERRGDQRRAMERGRSRSPRGKSLKQRAFAEADSHRNDVSPGPGRTKLCRNFNVGTCRKGDHKESASSSVTRICRYSHLCWLCRNPRCGGAWTCSDPTAKSNTGTRKGKSGGKGPVGARAVR